MEELEALAVVGNPEAFEIYNETIRALKAHCKRYLRVLDSGRYEYAGGTTRLDRHRANLCRENVEEIVDRIAINGELPNNNYLRIAMTHANQYLGKLKDLCEDVSRQYAFIGEIERYSLE